MSTKKKVSAKSAIGITKHLLAVIGFLFIVLLGVAFVYNNFIVPWPYRDELRSCLKQARTFENPQMAARAEEACFNTYPHFN